MTLRPSAHWWPGLGLAAALLASPLPAQAWSLPFGKGSVAATSSGADALPLARRISDATRKRNYSGTFVVNTGRSMSSYRLIHFNEGRQQVEKLELLDGQARVVYRHNDLVHVVWPRQGEGAVEARDPIGTFPGLWAPDSSKWSDLYEAQQVGTDRIAGWDATIWTIKPRDDARYTVRVWLEPQSQLVLRADTVNPRGEVIESSAFTDLQIDIRSQYTSLVQEMQKNEGLRLRRLQSDPTDLEKEGWTLGTSVPGFQLVRCSRRPVMARPLPPREASRRGSPTPAPGEPPAVPDAHQDSVLQALFSDGLTHVSLFIEPFDAQRHRRQSAPASLGATQAIGQRQGDWWITAVGDVPAATLQKFANSMERKQP